MKAGIMRLLTVANVLLAVGLVASALWLYGREHETRRMEREIRDLARATRLERETIRRLQIEWQQLRNPMRLEPLARKRLRLLPPDPTAVLPQALALDMLPLQPPAAEEAATAGAAADGAAAPAADAGPADDGAAVRRLPPVATADGTEDALGSLIRDILPEGGTQ